MIPTKPSNRKEGRRWEQPMYAPSIYSYKCRGGFFLSSEDHGSEGVCRGLKSRLELYSDMNTTTREAAIKDFTFMTDYELDETDANSLNQKTKSILVSPALIYKDKDAVESTQQLPEEELIKRQQWSCYGSTEVELLVLRNVQTDVEHIAAVAPRNVGVSIRKIEAEEGSITSIGVGWLNIVVDSGPSFVDEDQQEAPKRGEQTKPVPAHKERSKPSKAQQSQQPHDQRVPEEVAPRPSPGTISRARQSLSKFYDFTLKVGEQMQHNVVWLYENVQDDFPARSYAAGQKIAKNLPNTIDKTAHFMQKMIRRWTGGDHDDENDQ